MPALTLSAIGDIALAVALPVVDRRRQPNIPSLNRLDDVRALLHSPKARRYPPYALAVLIAYARRSGSGGKRRATLEAELTVLESEFPEFAAEFRAVYKMRGLARDPSALEEGGVSRCKCARHRGNPLQRSGATPPPLYACEDPDPDATQELVRRIVRAAGISSSLSAAAQDAKEALAALTPVPITVKQERRRTWGW